MSKPLHHRRKSVGAQFIASMHQRSSPRPRGRPRHLFTSREFQWEFLICGLESPHVLTAVSVKRREWDLHIRKVVHRTPWSDIN
jgi:hypothetical protein